MVQTLVRKIVKAVFFFIIMLSVARSLSKSEDYVNHALVDKLAQLISGDVNAESVYDAYFYIDISVVVVITTTIYMITMKIISKKRNK